MTFPPAPFQAVFFRRAGWPVPLAAPSVSAWMAVMRGASRRPISRKAIKVRGIRAKDGGALVRREAIAGRSRDRGEIAKEISPGAELGALAREALSRRLIGREQDALGADDGTPGGEDRKS